MELREDLDQIFHVPDPTPAQSQWVRKRGTTVAIRFFATNSVITAMDPAGQIRILAGGARTQVIVDRIGWLI